MQVLTDIRSQKFPRKFTDNLPNEVRLMCATIVQLLGLELSMFQQQYLVLQYVIHDILWLSVVSVP